jgi:alpha-ketoglutarate-dependent taurine dioxygenase/4-hydroxybenzoate polyprenyltransferase
VRTSALEPFGLLVEVEAGSALGELDATQLVAWVDEHRVVLVRGLRRASKPELVAAARRLGPLQPWSFGAVHEVRPKSDPKNYLYTRRAVPLHWDGAFAPRVPRLLVFQCLATPPEGEGGETVFVDTTRVVAGADAATRDLWRSLTFAYRTERVAHYGGTFEARLLDVHPVTHQPVLRFAEPVDDVNPVRVDAVGLDPLASAGMITSLRAALEAPGATLAHAWREGDVLLADNHALLHGRRPFTGGGDRHLQRVNVLDDRRTWRDDVRDMVRIRRPEFMVAEIPILLVAALSVAPPGALLTTRFAELIAVFFLLFHFGDMVNCLADRDLDAVYKTHLAEAVRGLGPRRVARQILWTATAAIALAAHLAWSTGRPELIALVAVGLALGHQYSFGPIRFKSRGVLQVAALVAVIFVGPMLLVSRTLADVVPPLAGFIAYGAMQQGTIAINTAEDLPEDEEAGVRTSAVALGLRGIVTLSLLLVVVGGVGVLAWIGPVALERGAAWAMAPLGVAWLWVVRAIGRLWLRVRGAPRPEALEAVRAAARWMPGWITATAWGTLIAAWGAWRAGP